MVIEEMVIRQFLPEVSRVHLQPMEIQLNYESQEHHFLTGEQQCIIAFLVVLGREAMLP